MTAGALTARGRAFLGAAAVMALAAYLFGIQELYCTALAAAVLAGSALMRVRAAGWDVGITRQVHPARIQAGQEATVELTVVNAGPRRTPPLDARDGFDGGRRWARFAIAPLIPGERRSTTYRLPANRRGVYHLGPLELRMSDPFGLAQRTRLTAPDTSLTVHPFYEVVAIHGLSSHRDDDRRLPRSTVGHGGQEFYTLREYVPGDDLRRVHWASTARVDHLVIRQPDSLRRGRLTVIADARDEVHAGDSLEQVMSAAASLTVSCLVAGLQVRVVTTGGFDSGHSSGRSATTALLDGLAGAELHRSVPGVSPFRTAGRLDPIVLVTTDRAASRDLESAIGIGGAAGTTVVAFETAGPSAQPAGDRPTGPVRFIRVPLGGSFRAAWTAWESASC